MQIDLVRILIYLLISLYLIGSQLVLQTSMIVLTKVWTMLILCLAQLIDLRFFRLVEYQYLSGTVSSIESDATRVVHYDDDNIETWILSDE